MGHRARHTFLAQATLHAPHECKALVEQVLDQITDCLARGEAVKLSGLGVFTMRKGTEYPAAIAAPLMPGPARVAVPIRGLPGEDVIPP